MSAPRLGFQGPFAPFPPIRSPRVVRDSVLPGGACVACVRRSPGTYRVAARGDVVRRQEDRFRRLGCLPGSLFAATAQGLREPGPARRLLACKQPNDLACDAVQVLACKQSGDTPDDASGDLSRSRPGEQPRDHPGHLADDRRRLPLADLADDRRGGLDCSPGIEQPNDPSGYLADVVPPEADRDASPDLADDRRRDSRTVPPRDRGDVARPEAVPDLATDRPDDRLDDPASVPAGDAEGHLADDPSDDTS